MAAGRAGQWHRFDDCPVESAAPDGVGDGQRSPLGAIPTNAEEHVDLGGTERSDEEAGEPGFSTENDGVKNARGRPTLNQKLNTETDESNAPDELMQSRLDIYNLS